VHPALVPVAAAAADFHTGSSRTETSRPEAPQTFEGLLAGFASMPGFEARFEEEKHLALLAVPLRSEGRLFFEPPASLLRRVEAPRIQEILVQKNAIRIRESGREEIIDLSARAEVRPLVEALLWLFSGNRAALEEAFAIKFDTGGTAGAAPDAPRSESAENARWQLRLTPRHPPLSQLLESLDITGLGLGADRIVIRETAGDRSVMRILEPDPQRRFTPAEARSLFGRSTSEIESGNDAEIDAQPE
jgi:hypothetical protein